jgi:ferredoxin
MAHQLGIAIERGACIGSGDCIRLAPTAFELDEQGVAIVLDPSTVDEDTLRQAERSCPSGAIVLTERATEPLSA